MNNFLHRLIHFDSDLMIVYSSTVFFYNSANLRLKSAANLCYFNGCRFNFDDLNCAPSTVSGVIIFCMVLACGRVI